MTLDLSRIPKRQIVWLLLAALALVIGLIVFCGHTAPKMTATGAEAGASPADLLASLAPIAAAMFALFKGISARDPSEIVNAIRALAACPQSQELAKRAEVAILDRLSQIHASHPAVLDAIATLGVEIAKTNFPPSVPDAKGA